MCFEINALEHAFQEVGKVDRAPGADAQTLNAFKANLDSEIINLFHELRNKTYKPQVAKVVTIPKGDDFRTLHLASIRDRIVQISLLNRLSSDFSHLISENAFGFVQGKGTLDALKIVDDCVHRFNYFLKADIDHFFDEINHTTLIEIINNYNSDDDLHWIIRNVLSYRYLDNGELKIKSKGLAQGSHISPFLSNLYLNDFDKQMSTKYKYLRYADDIIMFFESLDDVNNAMADINSSLGQLSLKLNHEKTLFGSSDNEFEYLGFLYDKRTRTIPEKAFEVLKCKTNAVSTDSFLTEEEKIRKISQIEMGWNKYYTLPTNALETDLKLGSFLEKIKIERNPHLFMIQDDAKLCFSYDEKMACFTDLDLIDHESGKCLISVKMESGEKHSALVFDFDLSKGVLENSVYDQSHLELMEVVKDTVSEACVFLKSLDCYPLIEFSGRRGYHIWLYFEQDITLNESRDFIAAFQQKFRSDIVKVDTFPCVDQKNQYIKLPLGLHPKSKQNSYFVNEFFDEVDVAEAIKTWGASKRHKIAMKQSNDLRKEAFSLETVIKYYGEDYGILIKSCEITRSLLEKAFELNYLDHNERLSLALIFVHLEKGKDFIHYIMKQLINYKKHVTQKFIIDTPNMPIGCKKLKERHEMSNLKFQCACHLPMIRFSYDTPLNHVPVNKTFIKANQIEVASKTFEEYLMLRAKRHEINSNILKTERKIAEIMDQLESNCVEIDKGQIKRIETDLGISFILESYK